MSDKDIKGAGADNEVLNIRVKDQQGGEISFKVKRSTPFSKIFEAYATRHSLDLSLIRFFYDGNRIARESTPKMFEMEDNDEILVVSEALGGYTY